MPVTAAEPAKPQSKAEKIAEGKTIFARTCQACHQADAKGIPCVPSFGSFRLFRIRPNQSN